MIYDYEPISVRPNSVIHDKYWELQPAKVRQAKLFNDSNILPLTSMFRYLHLDRNVSKPQQLARSLRDQHARYTANPSTKGTCAVSPVSRLIRGVPLLLSPKNTVVNAISAHCIRCIPTNPLVEASRPLSIRVRVHVQLVVIVEPPLRLEASGFVESRSTSILLGVLRFGDERNRLGSAPS
jgi:hypothetical protein